MKRLKIMTWVSLVLICMLLIGTEGASAASRVLKVSHQFAAGDVRDKMGRVFGDMVTEKTKGQIKSNYSR